MRALFIAKPPFQGSRYKQVKLFEKVLPVDVAPYAVRDKGRYDFLIVRGDKSNDYKEAMKMGLPYILLQHDVYSSRMGKDDWPQEREMIENAACIMFTSEHHVDMLSKYDVPEWRHVYLRPLRDDIEFEPLRKLNGKHIVYGGGITTPGASDLYGYRRYDIEIFPTLLNAGWNVHVYQAWGSDERKHHYQNIGCTVHDRVPQHQIYRELSQYTLGFQGYAHQGPQWYVDACRPNKLWEYLGAGIPTVGYNTGSGRGVYEGKWGLVAETLEDLPKIAEKASRMKITDEMRFAEVMDNDEDIARELVDIVMSKKKVIQPVIGRIRPERRRRHTATAEAV